MRYISTRGQAAPTMLLRHSARRPGARRRALPAGASIRRSAATELADWRKLSYAALALAILLRFVDDIPAADLKASGDKTYTADVYGYCATAPRPATSRRCHGWNPAIHLLELSNGPTLAFKDMAMQLLGNLFEYVLEKRGETINILGATSGDTGSAAEYAMRGKQRVKVFMLSPDGKMSAFQRAQMFSLQDPNIFNIAVRGMFDDAQDIVKAVSNDAGFKARYRIGAVNSINWARVMAQVVYYFKGYFAATASNDQEVAFCVPSGNFGNICAGHIARMMGLPIARLVLATNENDVLDEFFRTGVYRPRVTAETHVTSSPSMDISKASNFERFVFDLVGRDAGKVRDLWRAVDAGGSFDLRGTPYFSALPDYGIVSGRSLHADRIATIRDVWNRHQVMIDTHTADGVKVAREHREPGLPMIVLETAQPVKFTETIREALGREPVRPKELEGIEKLPQRVEVVDAEVDQVKAIIARHC